MSIAREWINRLRHLTSPSRVEDDLDAEIQFHIETRASELEDSGIPWSDALAQARREFGSDARVREESRAAWQFRWLEDMARDMRYAIRVFRAGPGFTLVASLSLGIGIGINTVAYTFYDAVVGKPLPVSSPEQIVRIGGHQDGVAIDEFSYLAYKKMREGAHAFSSMIATSVPEQVLWANPNGSPKDAGSALVRLVSANYFWALGVQPVLGRSFEEADRGVVVSYSFWQRRLHADRLAVGKPLVVQGAVFPILGVAAADFAGTGLPPIAPDLWLPLSVQTQVFPNVDWLNDPAAHPWQILARLKTDTSLQQATVDLDRLVAAWQPNEGKPGYLSAAPARFFFQQDSGDAKGFAAVSRLLMVPVFLILVIGGVNLVNLLVARNAARGREIAVRVALGAGRLQLIRQLCTESALLGLLGGAVGLLFSVCAANWIQATILETIRRVSGGAWALSLDVTLDWRIFSYTAVVSVMTGIAVGVWPATRLLRTDIDGGMKRGRSAEAPHRGVRRQGRNYLLAAQMAVSLVLLAGAGHLFRGALRSSDANPGFDAGRVFRLGIATHAMERTPSARMALYRQVAERVAAMPEIESIATADRVPFLGSASMLFKGDGQQSVQCLINAVSEAYFETLDIPILQGRTFTRLETETGEPAAVISEQAALALWPGKDPLGRLIFGTGLAHASYTIVGVAKSVRSVYLSKLDSAYVYLPRTFAPGSLLLVRTKDSAETGIQRTIATLSAIDPRLPSQSYMGTLSEGPVEIQRLMAKVPAIAASTLGFLALILASIGIYGTVSYQVVQRTHEIGVRVALGAQASDVIRMVLAQGLRPVCWGAAIGLIGALGLSTLLAALTQINGVPDLTYGAGAFSVITFLAVLGVLSAVALLASLMPVVRATEVEPIVALRCD